MCGTSEQTIDFYLVYWAVLHVFLLSWGYSGSRCDFETARGQEPMIVCPGQRKPDNMGVKNVPADVEFLSWDLANPRTTLPYSTILDSVLHGYRNMVYLVLQLQLQLQSE